MPNSNSEVKHIDKVAKCRGGSNTLSSNTKNKRIRYPFSISRVYLSVVLAIASVILSLLVLNTPALNVLSTLYYVVATVLMTAIIFLLKTRSFFTEKLKIGEENSEETEQEAPRRTTLILLFLILAVILMLPLFLIRILEPHVWFIGLFSFISGISIAEIFFYLYTR